MADVSAALAAARTVVNDLMTAADESGAAWTTPRAPGKWSPSQIVEHVARSLEESGKVAAGAPSKFPTLPAFLRPMVRMLFFNRVLRNQAFPKARTTKALNPASGPPTPAAGRTRLEAAFGSFERECRASSGRGGSVPSALFGLVSVEDYVRFQELHMRHHLRQMSDERLTHRA